MRYHIYIITNSKNAKQYVGITKSLKNRWKQHQSTNGSSPLLHASIKKHGVENFVFTHIATAFDLGCAQSIEQMLIAEHNTKVPHGYNLTDGGEGVRGLLLSEETKKVLSEKSKKMWQNEDHLARQTTLRTSEEYRKSQSEKAKAAWSNPDLLSKLKKPKNHGDKIRAIRTGVKQSEETVAKRVSKIVGKKRSEETKLKMSAANKAAWAIRKAKMLAAEGATND